MTRILRIQETHDNYLVIIRTSIFQFVSNLFKLHISQSMNTERQVV